MCSCSSIWVAWSLWVTWSIWLAWSTHVAWSTRVAWPRVQRGRPRRNIARTRPSPWRRSVRGSRNSLSLSLWSGERKRKSERARKRQRCEPCGQGASSTGSPRRAVHQGSQRGHAFCRAARAGADGSQALGNLKDRDKLEPRVSVRPVISVPRCLARGTKNQVRANSLLVDPCGACHVGRGRG
jgi:hypothetical protein